jgi:uncharacterized protein (TIGR03083 family)
MKLPKPIVVADLFPELLDSLIDLLGGLSKEEWDTATICKPWSVKDVCLHMLGGDISNLSWKRDGFSVFSEIESYDHLVQLLNQHNANWVKSTQHFSPELIIDMLKFTGDRVTEYFQSLDPFELGVTVDWVGPDPAPNWLDLAREYTERWHHQQHIRDAVGKPGLMEQKFLSPILDAFILALPRSFEDVRAENGTSLQITIKGNVKKDWVLLKEKSQWKLFEESQGTHQASIIMEDDLAWRVFTKGILKGEAKLCAEISGNQELGERVLETVSIIA